MTTECNQFVFGFHPQKRREIRAQFDGGAITSDGGGLLLREVEKRIGMLRQFAACFTDYRNPDLIEHRVEEMVAQRVYGLALGYEDLNDHEELRNDPLLAVLVEKADGSSPVLAERAKREGGRTRRAGTERRRAVERARGAKNRRAETHGSGGLQAQDHAPYTARVVGASDGTRAAGGSGASAGPDVGGRRRRGGETGARGAAAV